MTNIAQIDGNDKSLDGVVGKRTRGNRMVGQTNPLSYGGSPHFEIFEMIAYYNVFFKNGPFPASFFIFVFSMQLTVNKSNT